LLIGGKGSGGRDGPARRHWHHGHGDDLNLVGDGFEVVGYDVAEKAEVLITSLPNVDAFEQVMMGQGGIALRPDSSLGSGGSGS
jgi:hypothetical protein